MGYIIYDMRDKKRFYTCFTWYKSILRVEEYHGGSIFGEAGELVECK